MPSQPDYCPFCGARLSMDEPLDAHLAEYEECEASFEAWDPGESQSRPDTESDTVLQIIALVLIGTIMLYAVLVRGSILLGVVASAIVYIASRVSWGDVR